MKIRSYLRLGAIVGSLPYNIQNGQLEDATPVMANFNFIVAQVNANAQATGSQAEWVPSGLTPTFISATQFSFVGDVRSTFDIKRRLLLTVNSVLGGATITAIPTFGAGITTITVATDTAGFLTNQLSAVSYALLDAAILSTPRKSFVQAITATGVAVASATAYTIGAASPFATATIYNDTFSECAAGVFTAKTGGTYQLQANVNLTRSGATITALGGFSLLKNGANQPPGGTILQGVGDNTNTANFASVIGNVQCAAGDLLSIQFTTPTFTGGPMAVQGATITFNQMF